MEEASAYPRSAATVVAAGGGAARVARHRRKRRRNSPSCLPTLAATKINVIKAVREVTSLA